jgi:branched-chain amino acid aminotransferase
MFRAYWNGEFVPQDQLQLAPSDIGFIWGVTVTERLRTFGGGLFELSAHMQRLQQSMQIVGIETVESSQQLTAAAEQLAADNVALLDSADDLGMLILVTPGDPASQLVRATVMISCYPLPFGQWQPAYEQGSSLVISSQRQVPEQCWPPQLKCRSRMHYYLADQQADRQQAGARALLLDEAGHVGEATTANLVIYRSDDGLVSPRREKILAGISLDVLEQLANALSIPFQQQDLTPAELTAADELLMTSTSPCVWSVTELDGVAIGDGSVGPISRKLLAAWSSLVGLDIAAQAARFAERR